MPQSQRPDAAVHGDEATSTEARWARRALALLDLTNLQQSCTPEAIDELCRRATGPFGSTAAVCVWPRFVSQCVDRLDGRGVRIATVVNFPDGDDTIAATVSEALEALANGADEIDLVLPYRAFLDGRISEAAAMINAVRSAMTPTNALKVILESGGYSSLDAVREAARLAIDHGADFVKTSTGKSAVSATLAATVMILDAIRESGRPVGIKPSGGIATVEAAARFLSVADEMMGRDWATPGTFRFGASGLLDAAESALAAEHSQR